MVKMVKVALRAFAVVLTGFICAVIGTIVVINLGYSFVPGFTYNGWQGYEATGPIGFILGALVGLVGSSMLLFRKQTGK